jgi:parallel beta-helix repeat protein
MRMDCPQLIRASALWVVCACLASSQAFAAGIFYVDGANPSCSNIGPGSEETPYCTITAAANLKGGPGTTLVVKPARYREQVTVMAAGLKGMPFVFLAVDSNVVVDGTDDFSLPESWIQHAGDVWLASTVTWSPMQVFADAVRLRRDTLSVPANLTPFSFRYVDGEGLYVNAGGGNPGPHGTQVGRRAHGFRLPGRAWVKIEGFKVVQSENKGIFLFSGSDDTVIRKNIVTFAGSSGIAVWSSANVTVDSNRVVRNGNHGISLLSGVTASMIQDNQSISNLRISESSASGIYLHNSPANTIQRNRTYSNEDTGIQIQSGSNGCISLQNISWSNLDHGFDHLNATNTLNVGNVAWGNAKSGISIEGDATGTRVFDCIAVENGLAAGKADLYVDSSSTSGFQSDYNILWNSRPQAPINYSDIRYFTVSAFTAATGNDAHSIQSDPVFMSPVNGDFHLTAGSPAIDSGDASVSGWPPTDAEGHVREDDPATPNTGVGPITYAERGALEFDSKGSVAVGDPLTPTRFAVSRPYPNPMRETVALALDLPRAARVEWRVLDLQGRTVWSEARDYAAGRTLLRWRLNPRGGQRSGIYFAHVTAEGRALTRAFVLLR